MKSSIAFSAAALAMLAGAALAQPPGPGPSGDAGGPPMAQDAERGGFRQGHPPPMAGIERAAMNHLLAPEMAKLGKRSEKDVALMLSVAPPPAVARRLGIEDEQMRELAKAAREKLLQKALAAGLITADDVAELQLRQEHRGPRRQRRER